MIEVNGVTIPTPKKCSIGIYDVSANADRNAQGDILIDRVAVKRKLEMEWPVLSQAECSRLLSAVTDVFFTVTYPDPQLGRMNTIVCYAGDRTAPMLRYTEDGVPIWEELKMNFIER